MGRTKLFDTPRLFFTDEHCNFNNESRPGVGVLVDVYGTPVYPVIDWLIVQRKRKPRPEDTGSITQWAYDLRMFWEFLSHEKLDWQNVNDNFLMRWRDRMVKGQRVSAEQKDVPGKGKDAVEPIKNDTINRRLSTVFRFYLWCKSRDLLPEQTIGHGGKYRITVEVGKDNKRVWVGRLPTEGSLPGDTPTDEDVDKLHDVIDEIFSFETSQRNRLYLDWNRYLGLRGIEASTLQCDMIPELAVIERYIADKKAYPLTFSPRKYGVKTKGGRERQRPLDVDPMLLKHTRDYIDMYRPDIVDRAKKHHGRFYKEPGAVFLATTGDTLGYQVKTKTMQEAIAKAISKAGIDITPHGLRRLFAMETVANLYIWKFHQLESEGHSPNTIAATIDDNSIITYASQQLGHKQQTTTLKSYINLTKLKLIKMTAGERMTYFERKKGIAEAAYGHYVADENGDTLERSTVQQYLQAEADGLLDALEAGNKDLVFLILKRHFAKTFSTETISL